MRQNDCFINQLSSPYIQFFSRKIMTYCYQIRSNKFPLSYAEEFSDEYFSIYLYLTRVKRPSLSSSCFFLASIVSIIVFTLDDKQCNDLLFSETKSSFEV